VTWIYKEGKEILYGWAGCDFAGFQLKPHKKIISETLFLGFYDDPFSGLEDYAKESARHMKAKISNTIPLGWNSWYGHYLSITEEDVLTAAKLIRKKFPEYNFSYIQIDHGWQYKNICGYWIETNERFPHGIEWLARKLDRMGFTIGLWIALFLVSEYSPIFKEHPEYLIKDSKGNPYLVSSRWSWPPYGRVYCLDPTHPGAQRFIKKTLEYLKKAGVSYYKIDFLWPIAFRDAYYYNQKLIKGAGIYRNALSMISKILRGSYIYWCSNPINLSSGFNHSTTVADDIDNTGFRTGSDLKEAVRRFQTMGVGYAERPVKLEDYRRKATTIISRYFLHKNLTLINPDVLEVGRPGDYEEAKIRFSVVALCGGQIFLGDNLTTLKENDWKLISKCIPPLGKSARPVDLFENTYPSSYPHIWHLPIRKKWDRWSVVGIFNLTREPEELTIDFSKLNLKKGRKYIVFEFWEKRVLGIVKDSITLNMPPVTTKLLMIKEYPAHPAVLSTDMHFSQGAVELEDVDFDFQHNILKGVVKRQKGDRGNIFIFVPEGYGIKQGNNIKKHSRNLYTIPVIFTKSKINWSVKFICKKKEAL